MDVKSGWKTTEWWMTMAATFWAMFGGGLSPDKSALVVGVVNGAYAIARGLAKGGVIKGTVGPSLAKGPDKVL